MNWTASLLRNQLAKERAEHQTQLNLLTSTSLGAQNYLALEENLTKTKANLQQSEENLTRLRIANENLQKNKDQELLESESQVANLEKQITNSKELITNLKKEVRINQLYYQTELRKVQTDYQANLQLFRNQAELLATSQQQVTNLAAELEQTQKELLEAKELISIYQSTDALSFFNQEPKSVTKLLKNHPKKLYYLFYSTDGEAELDLSQLESNLEDNCLFFGTFGNGKLKVKVNKSQAQVLNFRTAKLIEELFGFTKNRIFITDNTFLYSENQPLELSKGKGKATDSPAVGTPASGTPAQTIFPEEEKKKSKREKFGFKKKDK